MDRDDERFERPGDAGDEEARFAREDPVDEPDPRAAGGPPPDDPPAP